MAPNNSRKGSTAPEMGRSQTKDRPGETTAQDTGKGQTNVQVTEATDQTTAQKSSDQENKAAIKKGLDIISSLEDLQTEKQRRVLDTVAQVHKCGLESILSLPQLVVCGDQSADKSSVLEALTDIPFPRNDNLCTRFATEIILRRATTNSLTIKIIPDTKRLAFEQSSLQGFKESITNFDELPRIMSAAATLMDVGKPQKARSKARAFTRDVLSIEIEGPSRPQLTLVDIPGLIHTETKGVTQADLETVAEITDVYIYRPRTICLAVVSATNDYANQKVLTKVRDFDPQGHRTLGIITNPDTLPQGSGSEKSFLTLARNEDIEFRLGWHVLKNRKFEENEFSLQECNSADLYFRTSNFKSLPDNCLGIERICLSQLLFEHVEVELPELRNDLEEALLAANDELKEMGESRANPSECKAYLSQLSLEYSQLCKAAVDGHYGGEYFNSDTDDEFDLKFTPTIRRIRVVVRYMNTGFAENIRVNGHKYQVDTPDDSKPLLRELQLLKMLSQYSSRVTKISPKKINRDEALEWSWSETTIPCSLESFSGCNAPTGNPSQ